MLELSLFIVVVGIIGTLFPNFVLEKICFNFSDFLTISSSFFGNKSILLNAIVIF